MLKRGREGRKDKGGGGGSRSVCEKWCVKDLVCVTKTVCDKDGVWKMVWWKMVCDKDVCERCRCKMVCERWWVKDGVWQRFEGCVKDGVWQRCVGKMVCKRWWVKDGVWQRFGVKDGVWKMVCDKDGVWKRVCQRCCVKNGVWQSGVWKMVCDKDGVWQRWCVKDGVWKMVCVCVCLPRKTKVDVTKCQTCHMKRRWMSPSATPAKQSAAASPATKRAKARPSATPEPAQGHKFHACHAKRSWCRQVPRPPRETEIDVSKCQACHAKCRGVTGDQSRPKRATRASPVPKCHACHAKRRLMSPSARPATWNEGRCHQAPRLPRKVPRRHRRPVRAQARHQSQPSALSVTPATWNEGRCR